jgi:hypothetical protein
LVTFILLKKKEGFKGNLGYIYFIKKERKDLKETLVSFSPLPRRANAASFIPCWPLRTV